MARALLSERSRLRAAGLGHDLSRPGMLPLPASTEKDLSSAMRPGGATGASAPSTRRAGFVVVDGLEPLILSLLERMQLPASVWQCAPPISAEDAERGLLPDQPSPLFKQAGAAGGWAQRCYHPAQMVSDMRHAKGALSGTLEENPDLEHSPDPAAPHVAVQYVSRLVLRNAFGLAAATGRRLVLPRLWALCERHWWQLVDCRVPGMEHMPMPYEAPYDLLFSLESWERIRGVEMVEQGAFERQLLGGSELDGASPSAGTKAAVETTVKLRLGDADSSTRPLLNRSSGHRRHSSSGGGGGGSSSNSGSSGLGGGDTSDPGRSLHLPLGSTFDAASGALAVLSLRTPHTLVRIDAASLLRFSPCGFHSRADSVTFQRNVVEPAFSGQYSFCSQERNPHIDAILAEARQRRLPEEQLLKTRRNWCGTRASHPPHTKR